VNYWCVTAQRHHRTAPQPLTAQHCDRTAP